MKKRKEFLKLKKFCRFMDDMTYPGYPFSRNGAIDFKTKDCYTDNCRRDFVTDEYFDKFKQYFEENLLFNILDSNFSNRGSFIVNRHLDKYKEILEAKNYDDDGDPQFFVDHLELAKFYFAVWSAIKQYKDSDKLLWFSYDGDSECCCVEVFDNMEQIDQYYKKYILGE